MKKILALILVLSLCLLCGCGNQYEDTVEEFVLCIEEERFEDAVGLMHPECAVTADEVSSYFALLEKETSIKFAGDFKITEYEIEDFEDEEATIDGEYTKASGEAESDGEEFTFEIKLVENDNGYGIYKIKFRAKE